MAWAVCGGLLEEGLNPQDTASRGDAVAMLRRFIEKYGAAPGTTPGQTDPDQQDHQEQPPKTGRPLDLWCLPLSVFLAAYLGLAAVKRRRSAEE